MGNGFAYGILVSWPLIAIYFYRVKTLQIATLWTLLGGFLLLPAKTAIDLPMIPSLDKHSISTLSVLIGCWFIKKQRVQFLKQSVIVKYLILLLVIAPFITAGLNTDVIITPGYYLPALKYYDGLSMVIKQFFIIAPFFIGIRFFRTYDDQLLIFKFIVIAGLLYSLPILYEIRMSPQLHTTVYGFFPHVFGQQHRFGGFRPVVFIGHGLAVSFFISLVVIASITLWKSRIKIHLFSSRTLSYYLFVILIFCKSMAPLIYASFSWVMIKIAKPKNQHKVAVLLVVITLTYPILSITKVFPHKEIISFISDIDKDRAHSLQFRFDNEHILLKRAEERLFFGWGGWGRNRVYDEQTGKDLSITDGRWISSLGTLGLFGFIAEFGLLAISVFRAQTASKLLKEDKKKTLLAAHALMVGIIMINLLPNTSTLPWVWLFAGTLLGRSEMIITEAKVQKYNG